MSITLHWDGLVLFAPAFLVGAIDRKRPET